MSKKLNLNNTVFELTEQYPDQVRSQALENIAWLRILTQMKKVSARRGRRGRGTAAMHSCLPSIRGLRHG